MSPTGQPPRPAPDGPLARWLLGAIVVGYLLLAINGSVLMPLWEIPDEYPHVQRALSWTREGRMPDRTNLPGRESYAGPAEPLADWVFAAGLHLLDLSNVDFLHRPRADLAGGAPLLCLHGPDEVFPFEGPVRRLHLLRLISVLCGMATVLATHRLGRLLAPDRPAVALLAAGLVASLPAFAVVHAVVTADGLSIALAGWSLVALCRFAGNPAPSHRRALRLGLLIGATLLARLTTIFLLALVPLALLLRRPAGERWRVSLSHFDWIIAGVLIPVGPFLAWTLVTNGDHLGGVLPALTHSDIGRDAIALGAGPIVMAAWTAVGIGTAVGWILLAARRVAARVGRPRVSSVAWLLIGASLINLLVCARVLASVHEIHGRCMLPSLGALACLAALAWLAFLPRPLALAGVVALFWIAGWSQLHELGPAYWPPLRADDPCFMAWDPLAGVPASRRIATLELRTVTDQDEFDAAPMLRWEPAADPGARYTVHLGMRGSPLVSRSYEDLGLALRDAYNVPEPLWRRLPPGMNIECQVIRLPTRAQVLAAKPGELLVDVSRIVSVKKASSAVRR